MNQQPSLQQLALFESELPSWEHLTPDQQTALKEVLSLLLEHEISSSKIEAPNASEENSCLKKLPPNINNESLQSTSGKVVPDKS